MPNVIQSLTEAIVRYAYGKYFDLIVRRDMHILRKKDEEYGASWLEYGGPGAFFVTVRKWDRIRHQLRKHNWDVFAAYADGTTSERFADTVMDFRNYLVLWEARAIELGLVEEPDSKKDWVVKTSIDTDQGQDSFAEPLSYKKRYNDLLALLEPVRHESESAESCIRRLLDFHQHRVERCDPT